MDLRLLTWDLSIESPPFLRPASYLVIITTALDIPAWRKLFTTFQDNAFLKICISVAYYWLSQILETILIVMWCHLRMSALIPIFVYSMTQSHLAWTEPRELVHGITGWQKNIKLTRQCNWWKKETVTISSLRSSCCTAPSPSKWADQLHPSRNNDWAILPGSKSSQAYSLSFVGGPG